MFENIKALYAQVIFLLCATQFYHQFKLKCNATYTSCIF
jgi:hypothetical protein